MNKTMIATSLLAGLGACSGHDMSSTPTKDEVRAQGKADDGHDWCQQLGWYGDGVCDDFCLRLDPDCATDPRLPELGNDPTIVRQSKISLAQGIAQASQTGAVIEAKFELGDDGKLSLSTYPLGAPFTNDATNNVFQELSGDPTVSPFAGSLERFHDFEHLCTSTRDLTLRQLSTKTIEAAVHDVDWLGDVYWAIPTIQEGAAGYGIWTLVGDDSVYSFVDGEGSRKRQVLDLGTGPGAGATDPRVPELGNDVTIVRTAQVKMSTALRQVLQSYPAVIEAKYEIGDDGKLSLSIYPTKQPITTDAAHQAFFELAGDPTQAAYTPDVTQFDVPDEEHVTTSARDLTLLQTSSRTLLDAVTLAEQRYSNGFVFWAIPTIRGTRAGIGVYVLDAQNHVHYLFIS